MKKKMILLVIMCVCLMLVGCGKKKTDESLNGKITLDINPSIELEIKDVKVDKINPLNEEANEIISRDFEGKSINEVFDEIIKNSIAKGYIEDEHLSIILGIEELKGDEGKDRKSFEDLLREACDKNEVRVEIIVPEITEEARHEAQGYGITPAKAAYILETIKDREGLHIDDLKDKSVIELHEMKESGHYCEPGYTLHGDFCEKAIKEEDPKEGKRCPNGTIEYKGKCYEEKPFDETDNLICGEHRTLKGDKCVFTEVKNAQPSKYSCSVGTAKTRLEAGLTRATDGDAKDIVCVDDSKATHPVTPCEAGKAGDGTEYLESGGKCYWHRAGLLPEGCPGKIKVGGECWDDATGIYICIGNRDGKRYSSRNEICEGSIKYTNPTISEYKCDSGYTLNGNKCSKEIEEPVEHERVCPPDTTKIDGDKCLDMNNSKEYEVGLVCNKDARLVKDKCVYYESVEAMGK